MLKSLIISSANKIPFFVFEQIFKTGTIPFLSESTLQNSKKTLEEVYPELKKPILKHLNNYLTQMSCIIPEDSYLMRSLLLYEKEQDFNSFYNLISNYKLALKNIPHYKAAAKITHNFYQNVISETPDYIIKLLIKSLI